MEESPSRDTVKGVESPSATDEPPLIETTGVYTSTEIDSPQLTSPLDAVPDAPRPIVSELL